MRIERLRVGGFGSLRGLDSGSSALGGLVVVVGPNEAGKSTIFHFLTSMLYGFHPASREGNPYTPWDGSEPGGAVSLRLDAGDCVEVERRLLSQPSGKMTRGGRTEDLRNRTLPWAEHVPRTVFRQVFAVTLAEMASLDEETWGKVQDRILGSMGSADVRPARHVVSELEGEAGEIWRPNRRGNQRARKLARRILSLRGERREAQERDRRLRDVVREVEAVKEDLQEAREARQAAILAVERVQALIPIRSQLLRIAGLREDAGPPSELDALPADPAGELEALASRSASLRGRLEVLAHERVEPTAALDALDSDDRKLLERADGVSAFLARTAGLSGERERLATLTQEVRDLRRRAEGTAQQILSAPLHGEVETALAKVSLTELQGRIRALRSARDEARLRERLALQAPGAGPAAPPPLAAGLATSAAGVVLLVVGVTADSTAALLAGLTVVAVGLALLVGWLRARPDRSFVGGEVAATDGAAPDPSETRALEAVGELLDGIPILPSVLADPGEALPAAVQRIQELLHDSREREMAASALRGKLESVEAEARSLSSALGRGVGLAAPALAHLLERDLRAAERSAERAESARRELQRLGREEERVRGELDACVARTEALRGALAEFGDGDPETGLRTVRERIQARNRAERLEEELERAHPDLDEIRERIRAAERSGESWTVDDEDLARRKASVEELTQRVESLAARAEALDRDLAHLGAAATVDAVDGEIAALEEEEKALLLERDRHWVLAQLIRQADRRFREEHQPDVLRRAGEHLERLTGGRYNRIAVDEASGGGRFLLGGAALPGPVPLGPPISTGTLEQAYLALRLAIVDHLDQGVESLPLFVDEVLVNWDAGRRRQGMALLRELAERRQVFVFTCHEEVSQELSARGASVLRVAPAR